MAKRGRPPFKVTVARCRKVEELVACGMTQDDVARVLGCSSETLAKHFPDQLLTGRAKRRGEVIELLFKAARGGNVAAQKKLEDMTGMSAPGGGGADAPKREPGLGKKEEAEMAAQAAEQGTGWAGVIRH